MEEINVDLHSDTQTRPSPGMREAMAQAPVGDEQRGEDPSVNKLCERAAELTGKESAVFMPSGTMWIALTSRLCNIPTFLLPHAAGLFGEAILGCEQIMP